MDNRSENQSNSEFATTTTDDEIEAETLHDAARENSHRPSVRELLADTQRGQDWLHREAEAMEFDPYEVYRALERVQENYDAFEGAERRPVVGHGENYVAFGLNGADWHALFEVIRRGIDDEEKRDYIARVVIKVMSDITGSDWRSHNSLPLLLPAGEVRDVLAYHKEVYETSRS
ncbi:hypothetical protein [Halorubellus salinus]|uniref:hypothetical protein n=1 Tax=Halorubellus salinus TaxID=755309 RepID=UPI001D098900|nr:hypothetical protein [Halorubellus salinus]